MAKLLKLRRGTTTQHGSFTGAEGEVTIDTTKDTAVVHDGSTTGGTPLAKEDMSNVSSASIAGRLSNDSIATSKIAGGILPSDVKIITANINDSQINNAKIGANAAIAGTKISPDFGSQTIATTGDVNIGGHLALSKELNLMGTEGHKYLDINLGANVFNIRGTSGGDTNHVTMMSIQRNGATTVRHAGSTKLATQSGGVAVTGNLLVTGNVDGRDVAADGTKLDGIESGATGDQTAAEIRTLVESASDSNVFTDADHSKLNGIESGATADQTKADIDALNINADQVDGLHASSFLRSDAADTASGDITFSGGAGAITVSAHSDIRMSSGNWTGETAGKIQHHANHLYFQNGGGNWIFRQSSGNEVLYIDSSGNLVADGNVTAYSDARLKTDISTINDALGICGKLRGVSYKWLKNGASGIGVIAQEVEQVIPEVVLTNVTTDPETGEEKEVKSVDYGKIVGVLINAINELKEEVEELKNAKITG